MPLRISRATWVASQAGMVGALCGAGLWPTALRAQTTELKMGAGPVEANAQIYYAQEMGYFKKNGLSVDIRILRAGSTTAAAVIGGDLQGGIANVVTLGQARLRNVPFVIFAPGAFYDSNLPTSVAVVAPNSTIKSGKDLNNTQVGGLSVGGLDQVALWAYIDQTGGDVSTVKFVEITDSAMAEALIQGRIAAASMGEPNLSAAGNRVKLLAKAWDHIAKLFMQTAWFTTSDWLTRNKDTAKRFSEALVEGGNWAMANPDKAPVVLEKFTSFRMPRGKMRFGEKLDPSILQPVYDSATRYKFYPATLNAADFIWNGR